MPDAFWLLIFLIGSVLFLFLVLVTWEKGRAMWRRYRHENGKPDLLPFDEPDDLPPDKRA